MAIEFRRISRRFTGTILPEFAGPKSGRPGIWSAWAGDMAKREKTQEQHEESLLVGAAKKIGSLAGKVAAAVGVSEAPPGTSPPTTRRTGKLPPKNKSRLPRRQKKAQKKAAKLQAA